MEKRALLAIALSVGILLAWQALFAPAPPPPPPGPTGGVPSGGSGSPPPSAPPVTGSPAAALPAGLVPRPPATSSGVARGGAEVTTPLFRVSFGGDGAVAAWVLRYRGEKPVAVGGGVGPLTVGVSRSGQAPEMVPLRPEASRLDLTAERPSGTLSFSGVTSDGVRVQQTLRFSADSYRVEARLQAEGRSGGPDTGPLGVFVYWTSPVALPGPTRDAAWLTLGEGPDHRQLLGRILMAGAGRGLEVHEAPPPALKDPKETPAGRELKDPQLVAPSVLGGERGWVALENDYFIAAMIPEEGGQRLRARDRDLAEIGLAFPQVQLGSGRTWEGGGQLYVGPKEWERLKAVGVGLEEAQARNYGGFVWAGSPVRMWWFCVPLLWLMNFFGTRVPGQNYGVAIILLTVLVKGLFYPLSHKSMSSMKQMQALQPQLNALRSKYKSDPQRFQREQMELFRRHKVNPMGGCLPMVVQIPIFYALYLTLQYSVELQGAPFLLWISDLSKKDSYYVLPILMGVSMLVQQKMTPTVGDPRQARVMLIMPVIFTFMFLEFPTGLVLYWLVNNVLSIAQQYLIERATQHQKPLAVEGKADREARKA